MIDILTDVKQYLIVVLICIPQMINSDVDLFMYLLVIYVFFGKMSIQNFCPFFNWVMYFFYIDLCELFVYFGYWPFISHIITKYFLPFSMLSFYIVDCFLCCAIAFKSN